MHILTANYLIIVITGLFLLGLAFSIAVKKEKKPWPWACLKIFHSGTPSGTPVVIREGKALTFVVVQSYRSNLNL